MKYRARVGGNGNDRDRYYEEFERVLCRLVGTFPARYQELMVAYALEWLVRNEQALMAKYPTGSLLATVTGRCRFIDCKRWLDRRAGKDVFESQLGVPAGDDKDDSFDIFDVLLENPVDIAEVVASELLSDEIHAGIRKHLEPKLAEAFISVEIEKKSVNETAAKMGTAHYNVSRWVSKAKEQLALAILDHPEDFGLAA